MSVNRQTSAECVKAAIDRILKAQQDWKDLELDASSAGMDRYDAKMAFNLTREEFWLQWENVHLLLVEREALREAVMPMAIAYLDFLAKDFDAETTPNFDLVLCVTADVKDWETVERLLR